MKHTKGQLCSIDLGKQDYENIDIDGVLQSFIGGRAVGTKLAYDRISYDADPLSPENRLYLATGPLQDSNMSFTGRMSATSVSPLTNGLLSSNAGGFLSRNFNDTGYAAVEIKGKSDELSIIHVTDTGIEFKEVPELSEATTSETCEYIEDEYGLGNDHTITIGPAGENLVRFASIMTSKERAFGRGGLGAVLGYKNVKAIIFSGESPHNIDIPSLQMDVHREAAQSDHIMRRQGTASTTELANEVEALPTRYFSELSFEGAEGISGDRVEEKKYKKGTCSACAFACKLPTRDDDSGLETEGPEYETVMAFGSNAGIDDIVDVMRSNKLCDELGMDTISCGDVVSAYLASVDEFGNPNLVHETVEKIAYREDIGDVLAEGVERCHNELDVGNWTVKGMEFPAHDGRTLNGQGLAFATSNRGADHMYAEFYSLEYPFVSEEKAMEKQGLDGKPEKVVEKENLNAIKDSAIICKFSRDFVTPERLETLLDEDYDKLLEIGSKVITMERSFNNQRGMDSSDDVLPYSIPGFDEALQEYYSERGWNEEGIVTEDL